MPYEKYSGMAQEDLTALIAYLRTLKPVKKATLLESINKALSLPENKPAGRRNGNGGELSMHTNPVVQVDEELSDLIPGFLARKRADAHAIIDALDRAIVDEKRLHPSQAQQPEIGTA